MTKIFYKDKPLVGIDFSNTDIKVMAVDSKHWNVRGYGALDLDPDKLKTSLENGDSYLSDSLKELLSNHIVGHISSDHIAIGIPSSQAYARTFQLPATAAKNLKEAVEIEASQYIPIPLDTLYLDYQVISRTKESLTVLMCAVNKRLVDSIINAIESVDLQPIFVESRISAVGRLLTRTEEGNLPTVIVDIGAASSDVAILDGGYVRVTGGLLVGGNTFTLDIAKSLRVSLENAHQLKVLNGLAAGARQEKITKALTPSLEKIVAETRRVMRFYNERLSEEVKLEQVLIVGNGSNVPGIGDFFTDKLVMPARVASPWQQLNFGHLQQPAKQFRARYMTVAGLASIDPKEIWK